MFRKLHVQDILFWGMLIGLFMTEGIVNKLMF